MIKSTFRPMFLAVPVLAVLSTAGARPASAVPFMPSYDVAPVNIDVNGLQCPHIFGRTNGPDNGLWIGFICKPWGGAWPGALNWFDTHAKLFPLGSISAVSSNDGDIFAFFEDDNQDAAFVRRNGNWAPTSLGHPIGASSLQGGPAAVAFTEGNVRKVAVFILASYQGARQLWMKVFHGDTNSFDGDWTLLGFPGPFGQNPLSQSAVNVTVASDGTNPAKVSAWTVSGNGTLYENSGTVTGVRTWGARLRSGWTFQSTQRPGTSSFFANGVTKSSVTVVGSSATQTNKLITYTRFNGADAWFGPLSNGSNQNGSRVMVSTNPGTRDVPASVFLVSTGLNTRDLVEEQYDYLSFAGITTRTLITNLDNIQAQPAGLYRGVVGLEDTFILSNAGDLLLIDGMTLNKKNFGHP
jgi:hypothetical protein